MARLRAAMQAGFLALSIMLTAGSAIADELGPFHRSLSTTPYGYAVVDDPTGHAPAASVERFEVRPGDCAANRGWDDCATDRERSERAQDRSNRIPADTQAWYGWSFFLPADHPNVYPAKTVFGQFHQTGSHPVFMFLQTDDGLVLDNHVEPGRRDFLIAEDDLRGRWHSIEINARWSRASDGFFRVYVDGELRSDYRGKTMTAQEVYLKYGVYRAFVSRYLTRNNKTELPAQIALFANVRSARTPQALRHAP